MHSTLKAAVIGRLGIPTVISVAEALYPDQVPQQDLAIGLTVAKAKPALLYTERRLLDKTSDETKTLFPRLSGDCAKSYSILKACRLADPQFVREADLKTVSTMIDELICINYYNTKTCRTDLKNLKTEFPQYQSLAQQATDRISLEHFWSLRSKRYEIPSWVQFVTLIMAHNQSSAGPERAFSQLRLAKSHLQSKQLEETTELLVLGALNDTLRRAEASHGEARPPPVPIADPLIPADQEEDVKSVIAYAHYLLDQGKVYDLEAPNQPMHVEAPVAAIEEKKAQVQPVVPGPGQDRIRFVEKHPGPLTDLEYDPVMINRLLVGRTVFFKFEEDWAKATITEFYEKPRKKKKYNVEATYDDGEKVDQRLKLDSRISVMPANHAAFDTMPVCSWILRK
jgi:hypothetical protein